MTIATGWVWLAALIRAACHPPTYNMFFSPPACVARDWQLSRERRHIPNRCFPPSLAEDQIAAPEKGQSSVVGQSHLPPSTSLGEEKGQQWDPLFNAAACGGGEGDGATLADRSAAAFLGCPPPMGPNGSWAAPGGGGGGSRPFL